MKPLGLSLHVAALALSAPTFAQDLAFAGSESYQLEAPQIVGAGGLATSASFSAWIEIDAPGVGGTASSASYALDPTATLVGAAPTTTPLVFGVAEGSGTKNGGQPVTVFGRHLDALGAGATASLGGVALSGVSVTSPTTLTGTTNLAVNQYGNSLGRVGLEVGGPGGTSARGAAYVFTPAVVADTVARIGEDFVMSFHSGPGDLISASYGVAFDGVAVPLWALDGATELIQQITPIFPLVSCPPSGHHQVVRTVANLPAIVGIELPIQGLAFDDVVHLTGAFTNMMKLPIQ